MSRLGSVLLDSETNRTSENLPSFPFVDERISHSENRQVKLKPVHLPAVFLLHGGQPVTVDAMVQTEPGHQMDQHRMFEIHGAKDPCQGALGAPKCNCEDRCREEEGLSLHSALEAPSAPVFIIVFPSLYVFYSFCNISPKGRLIRPIVESRISVSLGPRKIPQAERQAELPPQRWLLRQRTARGQSKQYTAQTPTGEQACKQGT